jgi:hypothetical protein
MTDVPGTSFRLFISGLTNCSTKQVYRLSVIDEHCGTIQSGVLNIALLFLSQNWPRASHQLAATSSGSKLPTLDLEPAASVPQISSVAA